MTEWAILDCNYLCYRAFYTKRLDLTNGLLFGFLSDVLSVSRVLQTTNLVFCWDKGKPLREEVYSDYKGKRKNRQPAKDETAEWLRREMQENIFEIRRNLLPYIGFKNVFAQNGYEADDLIASICNTICKTKGHRGIIVSNDHDFYQLIKKGKISFYSPATGEILLYERLIQKYGLTPEEWWKVKALMGCKTDNVKGVKGIGEAFAVRFLNKTLGKHTAAYAKIKRSQKQIDLCESLVRLPWPGVKEFKLKKDFIGKREWQIRMEKLGLPSLVKRRPSYME